MGPDTPPNRQNQGAYERCGLRRPYHTFNKSQQLKVFERTMLNAKLADECYLNSSNKPNEI
jgi:hypothetical protein